MEVLSRKKLSLYLILVLSLALSLAFAGIHTAAAYPEPPETGGGPSDSGGWTGEGTTPPSNPWHVQHAYANGYIHQMSSNSGNVYYHRCSDPDDLDYSYMGYMDTNSANTARDPYVDAEGKYVVASWKELIGGTWHLVIKISWNNGQTWPYTYTSGGAGFSDYEAHVVLEGSRVHAAYVSNFSGQNEVYYARLDYALNIQDLDCVSAGWPGCDPYPDTWPCISITDNNNINIFYTHDFPSSDPIYESWTGDGAANWGITTDLIPSGGSDMTCPEACLFYYGGDKRMMVVCDGRASNGYHTIYYSRFYNGNWQKGEILTYLGPDDTAGSKNGFPQIDNKGGSLMVVYRNSGGSAGLEGQGKMNSVGGEGNWDYIDDLFYNNYPYTRAGCMDVCSDGSRFFTAQAGTGPNNVVMSKREDDGKPTVTINDPGRYHNNDFTVSANASDDFNHTADWLLIPDPPGSEPYQNGILHTDFFYRSSSSGTWLDWPGGARVNDAPWSKSFPGATIAEGKYDFRVLAEDTALKKGDDEHLGVIIDRTPPNADLQISEPDGDNGWYKSQPGLGPIISATDPNMPNASDVKNAYYKFDAAADWTVYSEPFALIEGQHDIHYYAEDNAGNTTGVGTCSYKADFTDPQGEIISPEPERYFQTEIEVEATCRDDLSGVESITWMVDGNPKKTDANPKTALDLSDLVDGQHSLEAEIKDSAGRTSRTEAVIFYKDVTPPTVEVIEPTGEKWVRGMVTIKADIKDNLKVGQAEFYIDGKMIDRRTSAPWMAAWDTSTAKNGYHAVQVKAWDAAGNQAEVTASGETAVYVGNNISETNHFAEGCTRAGFDTWLCLQNPGNEHADVTVNYYLGEGQGSASTRTYSLPPHSRSTIYVNADVGADKDVSIQVTSSKPIVSERPMYFDYQGTAAHHWQGGHTAQGAHFPREEWCFAEGCTRNGFETWLCLQNPEGREAQVKVEYMMENGATLDRTYRVAPWSRGTVLVNQEVGEGHDVSMRVISNSPIVAERPVYFLYQGMWDGGHNVMGAAQPEKEWYFAEGCTRTGFNQWICLMNPNQEAATARIAYVMEDGGRIEREYVLAPRSRFTVNVNNDVARQHDVSSCIISDLPIVVERPMYFLYNSFIDEGSNAMGVCRPGSSWYLAEGCTRTGFEEWICLMNPGEETAEVILRFMLEDSSEREHVVNVPPNTRVTVKVNDIVGPDHDVSTEVMSNQPVIVERPMYSLYRGSCPSGDTLSGYTFNP